MGFFSFLSGFFAPPSSVSKEDMAIYRNIRKIVGNPFEQNAETAVINIIRAYANLDPSIPITRRSRIMELIGGDELDVVELTMAVEHQYDKRVQFSDLPDEEIPRLTVGDLIADVERVLGR